MADFISIIMIIIFACFAAKKLIIPRIVAKKAAKGATPTAAMAGNILATDTAVKTVTESRPITFIEVREIPLYLPDNESGADREEDRLYMRFSKTANEMLLNASLRGRNVQFGAINAGGLVILYTTYTT